MLGIKFWPNPNDTFTMPSNNANMSLVMPGFPVPAANASLACTNFKLPNDTAYQSIRYEGFAASPLVHHMNVYACGAGVVPAAEAGSVYDCSKALPVGCETLQFMWGPGAVPFSAPPQAGFNFGAGGAGFYVLQVHYQNPKGLKMVREGGGAGRAWRARMGAERGRRGGHGGRRGTHPLTVSTGRLGTPLLHDAH